MVCAPIPLGQYFALYGTHYKHLGIFCSYADILLAINENTRSVIEIYFA